MPDVLHHPVLREIQKNRDWNKAVEMNKNRDLKIARQKLLEFEKEKEIEDLNNGRFTNGDSKFRFYVKDDEISISSHVEDFKENMRRDNYVTGLKISLSKEDKIKLMQAIESTL